LSDIKHYVVKLYFRSPLRATKPPAALNLAEKHLKAVRGRILEYLKQTKNLDEAKAEAEAKEWLESILNVFPRKPLLYNGGEIQQVAFPSRWLLGFFEERAKALKLHSIVTREVIYQGTRIKPSLIGLIKSGKPITDEDVVITEEGIVSKKGKQSALKHFETIFPPLVTEKISIFIPISEKVLQRLIEFGRLGATRGQGCGEFVGKIIKASPDGGQDST